jgi:hypothetical protein
MAFHPRKGEWTTESGIVRAQPMESGDAFSHVTYRTPFSDGKQIYSPPGWGHVSWASTTFLKATPVGLISWKKAQSVAAQWVPFLRYLLIYPLPSCTFVGGNLNWGGVEGGGWGLLMRIIYNLAKFYGHIIII